MAACRYLVLLKLQEREDWVRGMKFFSRPDAEACARALKKSFAEVEDCVVVEESCPVGGELSGS
jgi:hypothetical protein